MGAILVQLCYTKKELRDISVDAGLDEETAQAHVDSNFRHSPSLCMDIFFMEGIFNEHVTSSGCCDCKTSFVSCNTSMEGLNVKRCSSETSHCTFPKLNETIEFFRVADRDENGIMTIAEVEESQDKFPFNDANPIGEGTIVVAFSMLIKVFGEWMDAISYRAFIDVVAFRKFPEHYAFPAPRRILVQKVLFRPPAPGSLSLASALTDQSGLGNNLSSEPSNIGHNGDTVKLEGHFLRAPHSPSLNMGTRRYRDAFTVGFAVKPTSIAYNDSIVLVKKGRGLLSANGETDGTAGWGFGQYSTNGLFYVARDDVGRCEGELVLDSGDWRPLDRWIHIAVTFERSAGKVFFWLDGKRQNSTQSLRDCNGSWANTEDLEIGRAYGREMQGEMQNFTIFNGSASAEQIRNWTMGLF